MCASKTVERLVIVASPTMLPIVFATADEGEAAPIIMLMSVATTFVWMTTIVKPRMHSEQC